MYYYLVVAYKHCNVETQMQCNQLILDKAQKFDAYHIVREYGKQGDTPHINVVLKCKETRGRSYKQQLQKFFETRQLLTDNTLRGQQITNDVNLANVMCGYLQKETKAEVLQTRGFDLEALAKHQQQKRVEITQTFEPITLPAMHSLVFNYATEKYKNIPWDKSLFRTIVVEIAKYKDITNVYPRLKHLYLSLCPKLGDNTTLAENISRELEFI